MLEERLMLSSIPPSAIALSRALPFNRITPMSGKSLPYEPEPFVYPCSFFLPADSTPNEPVISSYTRPESENDVVATVLLLSVSLSTLLLPEICNSKSRVPGKSFSLYLARSILIT